MVLGSVALLLLFAATAHGTGHLVVALALLVLAMGALLAGFLALAAMRLR